MKLIFILAFMFLVSFSAFAQFRLSTTFSVQGSASTIRCRIGSHDIYDGGTIPNQKAAGRSLCTDLGLLPLTGFTQASTIGTFYRHTTDVATTNCALRTEGAAAGSVTCQSSATYTGE